jgi:hypothetical protein
MIAAKRLHFPDYDIYRSLIAIAFITIGILLEHRKLIKGFKEGFKINFYSFIPSILLIAILFVPYDLGMRIIGFGIARIIMQHGLFRSVISIISGIYLVRSIIKED